MTRYEIINPGDRYEIDCPDLAIATVACVLLGNGSYGLRPIGGEGVAVPILQFEDHEAWCQEHLGKGLTALLAETGAQRAGDLASALESVLIGSADACAEARAAVAAMSPEAAAAYLADRHDRLRTSCNDIGALARILAEARRAKAAPLAPELRCE